MTSSYDTCYQNGKQLPAITLILRLSIPHHHTLAASLTTTTMSIISPTASTTNGKQHAHLLREFYGIDGGTPEQQDSSTTLFFLGNLMEHNLYLKCLQGWLMEKNY
jgi:hypothetical protein